MNWYEHKTLFSHNFLIHEIETYWFLIIISQLAPMRFQSITFNCFCISGYWIWKQFWFSPNNFNKWLCCSCVSTSIGWEIRIWFNLESFRIYENQLDLDSHAKKKIFISSGKHVLCRWFMCSEISIIVLGDLSSQR